MQSRPPTGVVVDPTAGGPKRWMIRSRRVPRSTAWACSSVIELRFCASRSRLSTVFTPSSTALPRITPQATHPPIPRTIRTPRTASTMMSARVPLDEGFCGGGPAYGYPGCCCGGHWPAIRRTFFLALRSPPSGATPPALRVAPARARHRPRHEPRHRADDERHRGVAGPPGERGPRPEHREQREPRDRPPAEPLVADPPPDD